MTGDVPTSGSAPVGIVVPVYRDVDDVRRCLESVVRHAAETSTPAELDKFVKEQLQAWGNKIKAAGIQPE